MKTSRTLGIFILALGLGLSACSSSGGGGAAPAPAPQVDTLAAPDDTLSKTEEDLVASGQVEQDAVDAEAPNETL